MYYLTPLEEREADSLRLSFNENAITYNVAEYLLGDCALPEYILEISEDIKSIDISSLTEDADRDEGQTLLGNIFNVDKKTANDLISSPKKAGICLRALRDKYEEIKFKESRTAAENRGFLATLLWTIKQAMYWIVKRFGDLKDEITDLLNNNPENTSRTKRDLAWFKFREKELKHDALM